MCDCPGSKNYMISTLPCTQYNKIRVINDMTLSRQQINKMMLPSLKQGVNFALQTDRQQRIMFLGEKLNRSLPSRQMTPSFNEPFFNTLDDVRRKLRSASTQFRGSY
ncbi:hypothetical protein SS50377_24935 [Spironucleus salmonicida]|uniref:Uncharacterized protein n=1 Tax=Spironucleus salmonicida TaxID=348837 RepID=V6LIC8_9EUKA|nr:hypothetical protein SS50377_24935 [Spironucleus salmonicida]|eukprot:EST43466.1 Hypothetical protein SS50377_16830 [Spironucleus salmonicida]